MKKILFLLSVLVLTVCVNAQSNEERLKQIDAEIKTAVEAEDYGTAEKLKKEKEIRLQMKEAIDKGDFAKAGELKAQLGGGSKIKKSEDKPKEKNEPKEIWKKFEFDVAKDPNIKPEFPAMRLCDDKRYVNPIGIINGIEIGYYMDIDSDIDFDGYSDTYYDITLVFRNLTGKKLIYNNPLDLVGQVKFTGEEVEIYLNGYSEERLGGKCPFYAEFLDHEGGKYVMEPNVDYYGDYSINQDSEGWLEMIWLRRIKPLWFESYIPAKQYLKTAKTDVRFFPEADLSKSPNQTVNGFITKQIKLPNKRVECTFAERGISLKTPLKSEGQDLVLFENEKLKVTYFIDESKGSFKKDGGYMKYPITIKIHNKSNEVFDPNESIGKTTIGYLEFHNSYRLPIRCAKKDRWWWEPIKIEPNGVYEYTDKLFVTLYSGELFVGSSITKRAVEEKREMIPVGLWMHKLAILGTSELGGPSPDGKTYIKVFIKRAERKDGLDQEDYLLDSRVNSFNTYPWLFYLGRDVSKYTNAQPNTITEFEISDGKDIPFFAARKPTTEKKMDKAMQGKMVFDGLIHAPASVKKGWTTYILIRMQRGAKVITKEEFESYQEKYQPTTIKADGIY